MFFSDDRTLVLFIIVGLFTIICTLASLFDTSTYKKTFNLGFWEAAFTFFLLTVSTLIFYQVGIETRKVSKTSEQIGGFISNKWYEDGDHQESYSCNCDDDGCDTCYKTVNHRDFFLTNTTGDWWDGWKWSERKDSPCYGCAPYFTSSTWENAYVGMPVSLDHSYTDYVTAVTEEKNVAIYQSFILDDICPDKPYNKLNWYQADRVLVSKNFPDSLSQQFKSWNINPGKEDYTQFTSQNLPLYMDTLFGFSGSNYQNDTVFILMNSLETEYSQMCMAKWYRGTKNAMYIFIFGQVSEDSFVPSKSKAEIAVEGEDKNSDFTGNTAKSNVVAKNQIEIELDKSFSSGKLDRETTLGILIKNLDLYWNRQEMSAFKKYESMIVPSDGFMVFFNILHSVMFILTLGFFTLFDMEDFS